METTGERLAQRKLIRRLVLQEAAACNVRTGGIQGPVQPQGTERVLNGYTLREPRRIDPGPHTGLAASGAFACNGFLAG